MSNRIFYIIFTLVLVISLTIHSVEAAEPVTISAAREIYYSGDYVVVFGQVDTIFEGMPVIIRIHNGSNLVEIAQVEVAKDGTYVNTFNASGTQWSNEGTYQASAKYSTEIAETTFEFFSQIADKSSAVFPVNIPNSGTFDVGYTIRGGEVKSIEMNSDRYSILVQTSMDSAGNMILKLPRESFDAQSDDTDANFIVLISKENTSAENFAHVEYEEVATGADYRTIRIPLEQGDKWVEVVGRYVIPEFGSIVIIILVVAVTSTIIISKSRLSIRYN